MNAFDGEVVVFTGFRSAELEVALKVGYSGFFSPQSTQLAAYLVLQKAGATVTSSVSGKTTILVAQDPVSAKGNKAQAARARGVRIMTRAEVEEALGLELDGANEASKPKPAAAKKARVSSLPKPAAVAPSDDDDDEDGSNDDDDEDHNDDYYDDDDEAHAPALPPRGVGARRASWFCGRLAESIASLLSGSGGGSGALTNVGRQLTAHQMLINIITLFVQGAPNDKAVEAGADEDEGQDRGDVESDVHADDKVCTIFLYE
jgi:hypothetical protein